MTSLTGIGVLLSREAKEKNNLKKQTNKQTNKQTKKQTKLNKGFVFFVEEGIEEKKTTVCLDSLFFPFLFPSFLS